MTDTQKQIMGYAIALLLMVITSIATAYGVVIPELKAAVKPVASIGARGTMFNGILCNSGETNCVESYGMNILVNTAGGTQTAKLTASTGTFQHAGFSVLDAATAITVTNGAAFTPTASYQPIQSAGTVTPTLATTGYTAGTIIYLVNRSNTTINFAAGGVQQFTSTCALTQYQNMTVMYDGTNWLKLECSND